MPMGSGRTNPRPGEDQATPVPPDPTVGRGGFSTADDNNACPLVSDCSVLLPNRDRSS